MSRLRGTFRKAAGLRAGAYLRDRLLVPHGRLLDEAVDLYIPISTRDDHPGPPEAHRHFHCTLRRVNPNEEKKSRARATGTVPGVRRTKQNSNPRRLRRGGRSEVVSGSGGVLGGGRRGERGWRAQHLIRAGGWSRVGVLPVCACVRVCARAPR